MTHSPAPDAIEEIREALENAKADIWRIVEYGDSDSLAIHDGDGANRVCFMATHGGSRKQWELIQFQAHLIANAPAWLSKLCADNATLKARAECLEKALRDLNVALDNYWNDHGATRPPEKHENAICTAQMKSSEALTPSEGSGCKLCDKGFPIFENQHKPHDYHVVGAETINCTRRSEA